MTMLQSPRESLLLDRPRECGVLWFLQIRLRYPGVSSLCGGPFAVEVHSIGSLVSPTLVTERPNTDTGE